MYTQIRLIYIFTYAGNCNCFRCKRAKCGGLLRPHVVWFGESLDQHVLNETEQALAKCDLCLVVSKL